MCTMLYYLKTKLKLVLKFIYQSLIKKVQKAYILVLFITKEKKKVIKWQ